MLITIDPTNIEHYQGGLEDGGERGLLIYFIFANLISKKISHCKYDLYFLGYQWDFAFAFSHLGISLQVIYSYRQSPF